jgi:hypothetical protein
MGLSGNITSIDTAPGWTRNWSKDINPVQPEGYYPIQLPDGIRLYCAGPAYAGWLAKHVDPLIYPFTKISFNYQLTIDDATQQQAQVVETDAKITDASGWTYDFSAQWNIAEGWMFQVATAAGLWIDTGFRLAVPPQANIAMPFKIDYALDYTNHLSSVLGVMAGTTYFSLPSNLQKIAAKQVGWQPSSIVTQLQQCNNGLPGAHSWKISQAGYAQAA